jgi:hypothetical protein
VADTLTPAMKLIEDLRWDAKNVEHARKQPAAANYLSGREHGTMRKAADFIERAMNAARTIDDAPDARPDVDQIMQDWKAGNMDDGGTIAALERIARGQPIREVEAMRELLVFWADHGEIWLDIPESYVKPSWLHETIGKTRAALAPKERSDG